MEAFNTEKYNLICQFEHKNVTESAFHLLTWQRHWIASIIRVSRIASATATNWVMVENVAFSMSSTMCCIAWIHAFIVRARFIGGTVIVHDTFVRNTGQCWRNHFHSRAFNKWIARIILWTATDGHVFFDMAHRVLTAYFIGTWIFTKLPRT